MVFRKQSKVPSGVPIFDPEDDINVQDPADLAAEEDFFTAEDLKLDISDTGDIIEEDEGFDVMEEGFSQVTKRRYGEAVVKVTRVNAPKSYGTDGKEVDFQGWPIEAPREIKEIQVPQRVIDQCAQQEDVKIESIKQDSAAKLAADTRACMREFEENKARSIFDRAKLANKALIEENRRLASAANRKLYGGK